MIIQAELRRKQSEYEGEACSVDKVIELPAQRFKQFSRALLADYDFIAENKNAIRHDEDARHCLLILDAEGTDGFLIDPQGYNYARYSAFVPNARSLLTPNIAEHGIRENINIEVSLHSVQVFLVSGEDEGVVRLSIDAQRHAEHFIPALIPPRRCR